jgi:hypothetical protein
MQLCASQNEKLRQKIQGTLGDKFDVATRSTKQSKAYRQTFNLRCDLQIEDQIFDQETILSSPAVNFSPAKTKNAAKKKRARLKKSLILQRKTQSIREPIIKRINQLCDLQIDAQMLNQETKESNAAMNLMPTKSNPHAKKSRTRLKPTPRLRQKAQHSRLPIIKRSTKRVIYISIRKGSPKISSPKTMQDRPTPTTGKRPHQQYMKCPEFSERIWLFLQLKSIKK